MINSKFHRVAKGVCMGLLAITSLSSYAIENGQHDYRHHNVGAIGFDIDGPDNPTPPLGLCSGFVISDRAFVTAAHCIVSRCRVRTILGCYAGTRHAGKPRISAGHIYRSQYIRLPDAR